MLYEVITNERADDCQTHCEEAIGGPAGRHWPRSLSAGAHEKEAAPLFKVRGGIERSFGCGHVPLDKVQGFPNDPRKLLIAGRLIGFQIGGNEECAVSYNFV